MNDNVSANTEINTEIATLGGGCFWCVEAVFNQLQGVKKAISGYEGGDVPNPSYQQICTGSTGHAEVVEVHFDPNVVSFADILRVFFTVHDPTTLNRQGADVGTQYRSVIFYHSDAQKQTAREVIDEIEGKNLYPNKIVTELAPHDTFYPAEDYHQEYYQNNRAQPYCQFVIAPKVAKFRKEYVDKLAV